MESVLSDITGRLKALTKPEKFLKVQEDVFQDTKVIAKVIYDLAKANEAQEKGNLKSILR